MYPSVSVLVPLDSPHSQPFLQGYQEPGLMKGLVYGRSEYWTVLQQMAESGETGRLSRRLSSRTSTADSENVWGASARGGGAGE